MNLTKPIWVISDFNTCYLIYLGKCDCFFKEQLKGYPSEYPFLHLSMMQTFFFFAYHTGITFNEGNMLVIMAGKFTTFIFQWQRQSNQVNE